MDIYGRIGILDFDIFLMRCYAINSNWYL